MFRSYTFTFDEVRPDEKVLMEYLQIPDNDSYPLVAGIVESTFAALKDSREIIGGYRILDYGDVTLQPGRRISGYMAGASEIALFICTAGAAFTDLSHAYQQNGDFLEAFVVESIIACVQWPLFPQLCRITVKLSSCTASTIRLT